MKKNKIIILTIISVTLTILLTVASTYSVIINVTNNSGIHEIVNTISIRDVFTNDNGGYNDLYYDVLNELNITKEQAEILMDSESLNNHFQTVVTSIVDYKTNNNYNAKLTNDELYNLIIDGLNNTNNITEDTKNKVISKSEQYKQDISNYVYDIKINILGVN